MLENQQVPQEEMHNRINEALNTVGLNVDTNQYINELSGGMKQKLAIAETILQQATTLFLDEPTAMLDVESTADLWQKIQSLWQDQTVLIVEHKVEHIWQHVDRVILMNYDGAIIADATPSHILTHYETLLTEYGVWHPNAWASAPQTIQFPNPDTARFNVQIQNTVIKRGKNKLIEIPHLEISAGEWISVTGSNGSGKTSLLESIMQLINYDGKMYINHHLYSKIKTAAKHMYLVYQNPELQFITNSVYDEIHIQNNNKFNSTDEAKQHTVSLLKTLNLTSVQTQHPYELSMGQKRRLSVAIALSAESDLILLDEPTFGLDSHNTFNLIKLFQQRVTQGQTIIMVTHDPEIIARYPTRRLHLEHHHLVEKTGDTYV